MSPEVKTITGTRWIRSIALCLGAILLATFSSGADTSGDRPSWSRSVLQEKRHGSPNRALNQFAGVTFINNERIAVWEEVPTGRFSTRGSLAPSSSFLLHVQVLNGATGEVVASTDLPTRALNSSIHRVAQRLIIRTGPMLGLYSPDLRKLSELSLAGDPAESWSVLVSNTGKTVVLRQYDDTHNRFAVVDPTTWRVKIKWTDIPAWIPLPLRYSVSDEGLARSDTNQQKILFEQFADTTWSTISVPWRVGCSTSPVWANDASLVNAGCGLTLLSTHGEVLSHVEPPKHWGFDDETVALSYQGTVVAARQDTGTGGGFWDTNVRWTGTRVCVYSLSPVKLMLTANVASIPRDNFDFALSPDGSSLAVLADGVVSDYRVTTPIQVSKPNTPLPAPN